MFEDLASKGYTRFTINIDQSCEKCYNMHASTQGKILRKLWRSFTFGHVQQDEDIFKLTHFRLCPPFFALSYKKKNFFHSTVHNVK